MAMEVENEKPLNSRILHFKLGNGKQGFRWLQKEEREDRGKTLQALRARDVVT